MTNRKKAPKPPYPDWNEPECRQPKFHGLVWYPTVGLRFVERQVYVEDIIQPTTKRILQQQWETRIVNNSGNMGMIQNPHYSQWRDIPLEAE
jgi:hypothetical protein